MINQLVESIIMEIVEMVQKLHECPHEIIDDYIDIGPENGMAIRYCIYCEQTFN